MPRALVLWVLVLASSCETAREIESVEVETHLIEVAFDEERGEEFERASHGARQRVWMLPERVVVESILPAMEEGASTRSSRTVWDLERDLVVSFEGDALVRVRSFAEVEHERHTRRVLSQRDELDAYVRDAAYRTGEGAERFFGDGRVFVLPSASSRLRRVAFSFEPGLDQEISGTVDEANALWHGQLLLAVLLDIDLDEARLVVEALAARPIALSGYVLASGESRAELRQRVVARGLERRPPTEVLNWPPLELLSREKATPERWLQRLDPESAETHSVVSVIGEALELESGLSREEVAAALDRVSDLDPALALEILRLGIRRSPALAKERLDGLLAGTSGSLALSAVEARVLEEAPEAVESLFLVLERRAEYDASVDETGLLFWALRWLRFASGLSRDELVERLAPLWSSEDPDAGPSELESLARELEHWYGWRSRTAERESAASSAGD